MEIKDNKLIIDIPQGMEIDLENSDLAKCIIKFKPKNLTYKTIHLKVCNRSLVIDSHMENEDKLRAINKLMNIAKYYNGDWKPEWNNLNEDKCFIYYRYTRDEYAVDADLTDVTNTIYFKNRADAQAVIDNPDFRPILDAIYKE